MVFERDGKEDVDLNRMTKPR